MAIYTQWNEYESIEGRPIWACEYDFCENKTSMRLIQQPIRGIVKHHTFYPLKKNSDTEIVKSRSVYMWSRKYADTYEECVDLYNSLVRQKIEWFRDRIEEIKEDFIEA